MNAAPGQATAISSIQHLHPGNAAASSSTGDLRPGNVAASFGGVGRGGVGSSRLRWVVNKKER